MRRSEYSLTPPIPTRRGTASRPFSSGGRRLSRRSSSGTTSASPLSGIQGVAGHPLSAEASMQASNRKVSTTTDFFDESLIIPSADPVEEASLYNTRITAQRKRQNPFYWDKHTRSLQALYSHQVDCSTDLALWAVHREHLLQQAQIQQQEVLVRLLQKHYPLSSKAFETILGEHFPQLPTPSLSGFLLFARDQFEQAKQQLEQISSHARKLDEPDEKAKATTMTHITHEHIVLKLVELWSNASGKEREQYANKAIEEQKRWLCEIDQFTSMSALKFVRSHRAYADQLASVTAGFASPPPFTSTMAVLHTQTKRDKRISHPNPTCKVCKRGARSSEQLIVCEGCCRFFHPRSCLKLESLAVSKIYANPFEW
eukprot:CAMPEP_0201550612 /NCGR_PEP_ID=MMETSP0173_2-20130828/6953_1 /ASSEMBLY_ACC=CAM_ASM_000268 /TAXON_ID=218659 /ORGANISM="Vexillifera sp., Strain DIVA3 564/2" /LENGTH=370 /DNA_ID=CAMNT_0047960641 /DNA_START=91 /DNA_END=1200 /DNA_ORIENTATION=+